MRLEDDTDCTQGDVILMFRSLARRFTTLVDPASVCRQSLTFPKSITPDYSLVDLSAAPSLLSRLQSGQERFPIEVYPNFITQQESDTLINELVAPLNRRKYEVNHWDAVITEV